MDNVYCIGVGELTEEQIRFLVGSGTNDMLHEELQQPQVHQEDTNNNTSTEEVCWIGDGESTDEQVSFVVGTGANDMLCEELTHRYTKKTCAIPLIIKERNSYSSSFDPTPVVKVVLDEIVDSVV